MPFIPHTEQDIENVERCPICLKELEEDDIIEYFDIVQSVCASKIVKGITDDAKKVSIDVVIYTDEDEAGAIFIHEIVLDEEIDEECEYSPLHFSSIIKSKNIKSLQIKKFNSLDPSIEPLASGHIIEQISIINNLMNCGQ